MGCIKNARIRIRNDHKFECTILLSQNNLVETYWLLQNWCQLDQMERQSGRAAYA